MSRTLFAVRDIDADALQFLGNLVIGHEAAIEADGSSGYIAGVPLPLIDDVCGHLAAILGRETAYLTGKLVAFPSRIATPTTQLALWPVSAKDADQ